MPSRLPYTRPGQFAARLGIEHDPLYVLGSHDNPLHFEPPALVLSGDVTAARMSSRKALLGVLNVGPPRVRRPIASQQKWTELQERAWSLLGSSQTTAAFNVAAEPQRYASGTDKPSMA